MSGINQSIIFLEFVKFTGIIAFLFFVFSFYVSFLFVSDVPWPRILLGNSLVCPPQPAPLGAPRAGPRTRGGGAQTSRSQLGNCSGGGRRWGASPGTAAALGRLGGCLGPKADGLLSVQRFQDVGERAPVLPARPCAWVASSRPPRRSSRPSAPSTRWARDLGDGP